MGPHNCMGLTVQRGSGQTRIWVQPMILEFTVVLGGIWRYWSFQRSGADGDFGVCGDSRACDYYGT